MSKGRNKVELIGHLGDDPKISRKNDFVVANFSIATSSSYKDRETGEKKTNTEWHRVVFYGKLAEVIEKYVKKGDKILVDGHLRTRKYTDKEGIERSITEIIGDDMTMLGNRAEKKESHSGEHEEKPYNYGQSQYEGHGQQFDDDIPF